MGPKPAFETVIFKFVPDGASRVAEIESGSSDVTLEIPYEEYDRLQGQAGSRRRLQAGHRHRHDLHHQRREGDARRKRAPRRHPRHRQGRDRQEAAARLATPIDTLDAPGYDAYDPSIKIAYDPEKAKKLLAASGYSPQKPVKFKIQTTRGFKPKDYETVQAIVGMWRKVGIEADIEVYEIAKHYELRAGHKLAPMAFYNWGDAIGDPTCSTGFAMFSPSRNPAWKSKDLDDMIGPLWGEKDEAKRIAGWKAVDKYIAEKGYVIPLVQYSQPIVYKSSLKVTPNGTGALQPTPGRQSLIGGARSAKAARSAVPRRPRVTASAAAARHGGDHAGRRRRRHFRAAARRPRRSHRDDDLAGRLAHPTSRPCARITGSTPASPRSSPSGRATSRMAISGCRSRCTATCLELLAERLPATLELAFAALVAAVAARRRRRRGRRRCCGDTALAPLVDARQRLVSRRARFHLGALCWCWCSACSRPCCRSRAASIPSLDVHFATPFYLLESLAHAALRASAGTSLRHMIMPTLALALPLAAVDRPRAQGIAARGDGAGLRAAGAVEGQVAAAAGDAGGAAQRRRRRRWR